VLLSTADVFLTNLRPEAVDRLGLGPDDVRAEHPRLIYASVTGYGREGPEPWSTLLCELSSRSAGATSCDTAV